jgi:hypothetical protein
MLGVERRLSRAGSIWDMLGAAATLSRARVGSDLTSEAAVLLVLLPPSRV